MPVERTVQLQCDNGCFEAGKRGGGVFELSGDTRDDWVSQFFFSYSRPEPASVNGKKTDGIERLPNQRKSTGFKRGWRSLPKPGLLENI